MNRTNKNTIIITILLILLIAGGGVLIWSMIANDKKEDNIAANAGNAANASRTPTPTGLPSASIITSVEAESNTNVTIRFTESPEATGYRIQIGDKHIFVTSNKTVSHQHNILPGNSMWIVVYAQNLFGETPSNVTHIINNTGVTWSKPSTSGNATNASNSPPADDSHIIPGSDYLQNMHNASQTSNASPTCTLNGDGNTVCERGTTPMCYCSDLDEPAYVPFNPNTSTAKGKCFILGENQSESDCHQSTGIECATKAGATYKAYTFEMGGTCSSTQTVNGYNLPGSTTLGVCRYMDGSCATGVSVNICNRTGSWHEGTSCSGGCGGGGGDGGGGGIFAGMYT